MWHRALRAFLAPFARRCDVLVVIDPDLGPGAVIARWLRRTDVVVCDVHENYEQVVADRTWPSERVRQVASGVARLGRKAAEAADWTIVADAHVPPFAARRRRVVRNVPIRASVEPNERTTLRAVYVGDVRESRGAFNMVDGILRSRAWKLDIIGPVNSAADRRRLRELIGESDRVHLWGRLDPVRSWEVAGRASVGLSLLANTPAFRDSMPSKVYQYLNSGMAVITSPLERPATLVLDNEVGSIVDSAESLTAQLDYWADNLDELRACQAAAIEWSQRYLPDIDEFLPVCQEIVHARVPTDSLGTLAGSDDSSAARSATTAVYFEK